MRRKGSTIYGIEHLAVGQAITIPKAAPWMDQETFVRRVANSAYAHARRSGWKVRTKLHHDPMRLDVERVA